MKSIIQMIDDANVQSPEDEAFEKKIMELINLPLVLTNRNHGKQVRIKILEVVNYWLKVKEETFNGICDAVQQGHAASLLIDDIQDESVLRRGYPAAYTIYGIPKTMICTDWIIAEILANALEQRSLEQIRPYLLHFNGALLGQSQEMKWRDTGKCPTEEEYLRMIIAKSGSPIIAGFEWLSSCAKTRNINLTNIGVYFTLAFQIADDLNNLTHPVYFKQKGYCEDLEEGKFGFPIIHAIRSCPDDKRVMEIVQQRPKDYERKRRCVDLLEEFGSFDYTCRKIQLFKDLLAKEAECIGPNPLLPRMFAVIDNYFQTKVKEV